MPNLGHQRSDIEICPNFKLGQWLTWGTKGPTLKLPQFKIWAMVNLRHQMTNFKFPQIKISKFQIGSPEIEISIWGKLELPQF